MATDVETIQLRLAEAEAALHKLVTGSLEVEIQKGDRVVKFSLLGVNGIDTLRRYIADLKSQLLALGAITPAQAGRRRAMNVVF